MNETQNNVEASEQSNALTNPIIGPLGLIRPIPPECIALTPDQTLANAEKLFPTHQRPTCPLRARAWDTEKQNHITARLQIEQQRAAFLNWSKTYAAENNLDLQTFVLNGEARHAYAQWQDSLRAPAYTTQEEIMAAAQEQYGARPTHHDDLYYWNRNRATFIQEAQHRIHKYELALAAEDEKTRM